MSAAEKIPWQELPMDAAECAALWKVSPEHFLARIACRPGFPQRLQRKPAVWKAGEVIAYRDRHRAEPKEKGPRRPA